MLVLRHVETALVQNRTALLQLNTVQYIFTIEDETSFHQMIYWSVKLTLYTFCKGKYTIAIKIKT